METLLESFDLKILDYYLNDLHIRNLTIKPFYSKNKTFLIFYLKTFNIETIADELDFKICTQQEMPSFKLVADFVQWIQCIYSSMLLHESLEFFQYKNKRIFEPHCKSQAILFPTSTEKLNYMLDSTVCPS
jgi:hypothetical protein